MSKENNESERLTLGPLPLEQRKSVKRNINYELSVLDGVFPIQDLDAGDLPSDRALVTPGDIFWIVVSILMHIIDCFMDLNLARDYWMASKYNYLIWTCIFMFLPSFVNIIISIHMYNQDRQLNPNDEKRETTCSKLARTIVLWPFILILQLAPVLRHIDNLAYAWKSYRARMTGDQARQKKNYLKMLKEEQDIALLRVLECFLEAAPHQVVQLSIMMLLYKDNPGVNLHFWSQTLSMLSSLIGMGWAMSSYHRSIRKAQWDKENISAVGNWLQFLWHFCITISRVVTVAAAASLSVLYTSIFALFHWLCMTIWIAVGSTGLIDFCRDRSKPSHTRPMGSETLRAHLLAFIFGIVYVFTYFKLSDGPTYRKHIYYYIFCGLENLATALTFLFFGNYLSNCKITQEYCDLITSLCLAPFLFGIVIMLTYYGWFHPTKKTISMTPETGDANDRNLMA